MSPLTPSAADTARALGTLFQSLDERPTVAAYARAASEIRKLAGSLRPVRVSLLASFTVDAQLPYLAVEAARRGFAPDVYIAPFNTIEQELLSPDSGCARHKPDIVFIARLLGDVCPPLIDDFLALDEHQIEDSLRAIIADTEAALTAFRRHSPSAIVLHNFAMPSRPRLGLFEVMAEGSQTETIRKLNAGLVNALRGISGAYVLDFDRVTADLGYRNSYDEKLWYLGRSPLSAQALPRIAAMQAAMMDALFGVRRKCLVLDLDNTIWGGIVGENGLAGIQLGHTYPGNVYRDFQRSILELRRRGVLLAINSKNNLEDVEEVFRAHPDMILKWEDFACARINWREKPQNMAEIAADLNIGLERLVFFDDNPAERERMRDVLPEVLTLPVPPDPSQYVRALLESGAFDRMSLTDEDRLRTEMYQQQKMRRQLEGSAASVEEFLRGLGMTVSIAPVEELSFPRALELLHKTNQFNLTTRRHSAAELTSLLTNPDFASFTARVSDRFGDSGIVGVAIVGIREKVAFIDSLLLSCRVIGRRVETAFLSFLVDWARSRGARVLEGEFIRTAKNEPAADFYERHGFLAVDSTEAAGRWSLDLQNVPFEWPVCIDRPPLPVAASD